MLTAHKSRLICVHREHMVGAWQRALGRRGVTCCDLLQPRPTIYHELVGSLPGTSEWVGDVELADRRCGPCLGGFDFWVSVGCLDGSVAARQVACELGA
jgi:hypothetical protein